MTLARRLKQQRSGEFALIRRFAGEPCFGVQLASIKPDEAAWAAALVESRGARFRRHQLRLPDRLLHAQGTRRVDRAAPEPHPPPRRGDEARGHAHPGDGEDSPRLERRPSATTCSRRRPRSTAAPTRIFVHGRTRNARYRFAADWDAIGEIAAAVPVPVIGNGDLLFPHEIDGRARAVRAAPP